MIIYPKKQQGGSIGKAGRMHVAPMDRSAILNFNPQVREIKTAGPNAAAGARGSSAQQKMYQGMLPSDQSFIQNLKASKMQEMKDKYANQEGYEGSQDNVNDLEEYRSYDTNMSIKGKHYASRFTQNAKLANSRKAEGSIASLGGSVLAQKSDGTYDVLSYDELMSQERDGRMKFKPLTVGDAILLRQSDPQFNSFSPLGDFVDNVLMNTYNPDDLTKSMKTVATQAKMNKVMINEVGQQVQIEDVVRDIAASGGIAGTMKTNRDKIFSLSTYFKSIMNPNAVNYLHNRAVNDIYQKVATGSLQLQEGQSIQDAIASYEAETVANYFYGAVGEELGLTDKSGGAGAAPQKKYEVSPMGSAFARAGSQTVTIETPTQDGNVATQQYLGAPLPKGNQIFNSADAYDVIGKEDEETIEGKTIANNMMLRMVGDVNFQSIAMADGTVLNDAIGLENTTISPNSSFNLTFIPVRARADRKGGLVPAFDLVANYQTMIDKMHELWKTGEIATEEDITELLRKSGMPNHVDIKPVLVFDATLRNNKDIDDRYLDRVDDEASRDRHEDALDSWIGDKKIHRTKAFLVVDQPSVFTDINMFGSEYIEKMDANSVNFLTRGRYNKQIKTQNISTYDATPLKKDGGKAPSAKDIHNILFGKQ